VLPGLVENSIGVLKLIAEQLSLNLHISLMSQYYPPDRIMPPNRKFESATKAKSRTRSVGKQDKSRTRTCPDEVGSVGAHIANHKSLNRPIWCSEYDIILEAFHALRLSKGWVQDYDSHITYRPDFLNINPFGL
jgi:hypothetical protein